MLSALITKSYALRETKVVLIEGGKLKYISVHLTVQWVKCNFGEEKVNKKTPQTMTEICILHHFWQELGCCQYMPSRVTSPVVVLLILVLCAMKCSCLDQKVPFFVFVFTLHPNIAKYLKTTRATWGAKNTVCCSVRVRKRGMSTKYWIIIYCGTDEDHVGLMKIMSLHTPPS